MPRSDSELRVLATSTIYRFSVFPLHVSTLSSSVAFVSVLPWGSSLVLGNRPSRPPLSSFCYLPSSFLGVPRHQLIDRFPHCSTYTPTPLRSPLTHRSTFDVKNTQ